jgi:hypothetical protein
MGGQENSVITLNLSGPEVAGGRLQEVEASRLDAALERWVKFFQDDGYYVERVGEVVHISLRREDDFIHLATIFPVLSATIRTT